MNSIETLFIPEPDFEDIRKENGQAYWWARDLMQ
jgi:hypothetical protein